MDKTNEWSVYPNFHLAFKNQNLVFFNSPDLEEYFKYYNDKENFWTKIRQIPKVELQNWLNNLVNIGVLDYPNEKKEEVNSKVINKGYTTVNLCPALYIEYYISKEKVIKLDKSGELTPLIKSEMKKILGIVDHSTENIIASNR